MHTITKQLSIKGKKTFVWFQKRSLPVKVLLVLGIISIIFFAFQSIFSNRDKATPVVVRQQTISETIMVSGNDISNGQTPIFTTTTGVITKLFVSNGDSVSQGQPLFSVKSTASDQERQEAYAQYLAAVSGQNKAEANKPLFQSQLETARKQVIDASQAVDTMTNNRNTGKSNPSTGLPYTQNEIDSINTSLTLTRENFSSLEKQYQNADQSIQSSGAEVSAKWSAYQATLDSTVNAPIDGTVANLAYSVGDRVSATTIEIGSKETPVLILADFSSALVKATLNEADITKVKLNQPVAITFDAIVNKAYEGHLSRIDSIGSNTQGVITYTIYATLDNPDSLIKAGMTANLLITINTATNARAVPNGALIIEKDKKYLNKLVNGKLTKTLVDVGIHDGKFSEISKGVAVGDTVLIPAL